MPHATNAYPFHITDAKLVVERDHAPFKFDMMNLDGPTVKIGELFHVTLSFTFTGGNFSPEAAREAASLSTYLSKWGKVRVANGPQYDETALVPNCLDRVEGEPVVVTIDEGVAPNWIGLKFKKSLRITGGPGAYDLSFAANLNGISVRDNTVIINVREP
jgi:hypothetical protein